MFRRRRQKDAAVFRPADKAWYIRRGSDAGFQAATWGFESDLRISGDFDGDGKTDVAVWRPENGVFYVLPSGGGGGQLTAFQFGQNGDIPIASAFMRR